MGKKESQWERTNVTNLLRNRESGTYYARVKVNGKQKWRTLETSVFSVAKLRLPDKEKEIRERGLNEKGEGSATGAEEMFIGHFVGILKERTQNDVSIEPATRDGQLTAIKAVVTTWPDLPFRDIRRVTAVDCRTWAARAPLRRHGVHRAECEDEAGRHVGFGLQQVCRRVARGVRNRRAIRV